MGRKARRNQGFNTPFSGLKLKQEAPEPKQAAPGKKAEPSNPLPEQVDDAELFRRAMAGVTSSRHLETRPGRVEPQKTLARQGPDDEALAMMEFESFARGETPFELTDSEELQYGLAPGVTHELLRSLQNGEFAFRRHLDLHGMTREEAHGALSEFITHARRDNERCVLVITGRGKSSPGGISVLKETLPRWLSRAPVRAHVLAFCTAQTVHGGPGAFYVLLRRTGVRPYGALP